MVSIFFIGILSVLKYHNSFACLFSLLRLFIYLFLVSVELNMRF